MNALVLVLMLFGGSAAVEHSYVCRCQYTAHDLSHCNVYVLTVGQPVFARQHAPIKSCCIAALMRTPLNQTTVTA